MPHSVFQPRPEFKPQRPHLESPYRLPTFDSSSDPYYFREWVRQLEDYFESCHIPESRQISITKSHLKGQALQFWMRLENHKESSAPPVHQTFGCCTFKTPTSFVGINREHYCGRDHPSFSSIRIVVPPYRFSTSLDGRLSIGSSAASVPYDYPLRPTPSHPSQPLASAALNTESVIIIKKCIKKKRSPEPETKCIHFVDANDITDNEEFFEDETEVIESDSRHDLNLDLGKLEPLNVVTLAHPDPSLLEDISLDKTCLDDINLISKEADLTVNTMKLNSEVSDLIILLLR
ncbi:hypothetical protein MA16_Dca008638 [Dendrobium catenatum]|uniref:Retrotransposon gag domain-containing protein n=1 Tax=Dendrobium catenatum TaxID=906689 RepID=A0A2I0W4D9_9ASPA|nr:hypothetical protein MA16_Dca008638 [Dendrobium catenatum]